MTYRGRGLRHLKRLWLLLLLDDGPVRAAYSDSASLARSCAPLCGGTASPT